MTARIDTSPFMAEAMAEARKAQDLGEVPVGAVVVNAAGDIIGRGHNLTRTKRDPSLHAEMVAIRDAGLERLIDCDLYVTLEPCAMCAGLISHARIRRLYYGAADAKGGAVDHGPRIFNQPTCHHAPEVYSGIGEAKAAKLLKDFFSSKR
ncbi:MAG: nucleoside deaminase [Alphaproteobacteria bacterium]